MTVAEPSHTATVGELTDDGIERFREKLGVDWPYTRWTTWNEMATRDGIRHYATASVTTILCTWIRHGVVAVGWGSLRPDSWKAPGSPPRCPTARTEGPGQGCPQRGPHVLAGDHARYFNAVREGDRIWVRRFYVDITAKEQSRFGGRSAVSVRRRVYWNQRGELVAIWTPTSSTPNAHRRRAGHPQDRGEQHVYSEQELQVVDDHYAPRRTGWTCDTSRTSKVGENRRPLRGPLVVGDVIAWLMGNGRHEIFPYRLNWRNRQRMGGFYEPQRVGAWDSAMRVHWDDQYARSVGAPPYDYGMLRNGWIMQVVTDWMGDDALLVAVEDRIKGFNTWGPHQAHRQRPRHRPLADWPGRRRGHLHQPAR